MKKVIILLLFIVLLRSVYAAEFNVSGVSLWMTEDDIEELGYRLIPVEDDIIYFVDVSNRKIESDVSDGIEAIVSNGLRIFNIMVIMNEDDKVETVMANVNANYDLIITIFDTLCNTLWGSYGQPVISIREDSISINQVWKTALEDYGLTLSGSQEEGAKWDIMITIQPSLDYWFNYEDSRSL